MHTRFLPILLLLTLFLQGCSSDPGLTGTWRGTSNGRVTTMALKQDGKDLTGSINTGRSQLGIKGKVNGQAASGKITASNGKTLDFTMIDNQGSLTLTIIIKHPATGQVLRQAAMVFTRSQTSVGMPMPGNAATPARTPGGINSGINPGAMIPGRSSPGMMPGRSRPSYSRPGTSNNVQRDMRLVGSWRYTKHFSSGSYSSTNERNLRMLANGTYQYGAGRFMATVPGAGRASDRGDVQTGQWRTSNGIIYIYESGGSGWEAYAKYHIEGNAMLMTLRDGTRMLWNRY